jgi:hypothetical protein
VRFENQDLLVRYLLGDLSQREQEDLEEEYFTNEETWEILNSVEDDLINSYVRGELSLLQRERFEKHFLATPRDYERVELARILLNSGIRGQAVALDRSGSIAGISSWVGTPALKWMSAAAGLAAAVLLVFLLVQNRQLRGELNDVSRQQANLERQNAELRQQVANLTKTVQSASSEDTTLSLLLAPGLLRDTGPGSQTNVLKIPAKPLTVRLLLDLRSDQYSHYDVVLRSAEGHEIQRVAGLKSEPSAHAGRAVALTLPSRLLLRGDYIIHLYGQSTQGKMERHPPYSLSVVR